MSIRTLLNQNSKNNKTLNLYSNSINVNNLSADSITIDDISLEDLTCDNLIVNISANLIGNVIPSSVTTPGNVLTNVDGSGSCQWAPLDTTTLICSDLTATTSANLRGNVIPSSVTTPGNVLTNVDGSGSCQWAPLDTTTLICSDLTATTSANLRGNIIPSSVTTPGNILKNIDGNGSCQWVPESVQSQLLSFSLTESKEMFENLPTIVWTNSSGSNTIQPLSFPIGSTIEITVIGTVNVAVTTPATILPSTFILSFGSLVDLNSNNINTSSFPTSFNSNFKFNIKLTRATTNTILSSSYGFFTDINQSIKTIFFPNGIVLGYDENNSYTIDIKYNNGVSSDGFANRNDRVCVGLNIRQYNTTS